MMSLTSVSLFISLATHVVSLQVWSNRDMSKSPYENVRGTVGMAFRHKLNIHELLGTTTESVNLELLTEDSKSLFPNSWVDLRWNEIYGFPLDGNTGVFTFYAKATTQTGSEYFKEIKLFVTEPNEKYFHKVNLCTTMTKASYFKSLDTRYALAQILSEEFFNGNIQHIKLSNFINGCFDVTFVNIKGGDSCDFEKINQIRNKVFTTDGFVTLEFKNAMSKITTVKSANISESQECTKTNSEEEKEDIRWLKSAAPMLILAGIVLIPVSISCYVCRGVRRRQNEMRQQQDKKFKEEQARINEQINEYKRACGLDESLDSESDIAYPTPKWKQEAVLDQKRAFLTKFFEQYVPQSVQNKIGYTKKNTSRQQHKKYYNPIKRMLDIRTTHPIASTQKQNTYNEQKRRRFDRRIQTKPGLIQTPAISRSASYNPLITAPPFLPSAGVRRSKSVSFFDVSGEDRLAGLQDESNSLYRRIDKEFHRNMSSQSCPAIDKLKPPQETRSTQTTATELRGSQSNLFGRRFSSSNPALEIYHTKNTMVNMTSTPRRKRSFVESVRQFAVNGKDIISTSLRESNFIQRKVPPNDITASGVFRNKMGRTPYMDERDYDVKRKNAYIVAPRNRNNSECNYFTKMESEHYGSPRDAFLSNYQSEENISGTSYSVSEKTYSVNGHIHNSASPYLPLWSNQKPYDFQNNIYVNPYEDMESVSTERGYFNEDPLYRNTQWKNAHWKTQQQNYEGYGSLGLGEFDVMNKQPEFHKSALLQRCLKHSIGRDSDAQEKRDLFRRQSINSRSMTRSTEILPQPVYQDHSKYSTDSSLASYRNSPNVFLQPQQKIECRSFESVSSDMTYMDLGSEYEVSYESDSQNNRRLRNRNDFPGQHSRFPDDDWTSHTTQQQLPVMPRMEYDRRVDMNNVRETLYSDRTARFYPNVNNVNNVQYFV